MFTEIFLFEIKYRLKRPATWIYFGIFLVFTFFFALAMGGAFSGASVSMGGGGGIVMTNSPYNINITLTIFSFFGVLVTSAIMGNPVHRDFQHHTHHLFFSLPISKGAYLSGRFFGSLAVAFFVFTAIGLGFYIATLTPWVLQEKIGAFRAMAYIQPYLTAILPNILFTGAIFFTMATLTRNILSTYLGSVIFLVLYGVSQSLLADLDNKFIAGMLDPFGGASTEQVTRYWSAAQKNSMLIPLTGDLLLNRLIWTGVGIALLAFCYYRFSFSYALPAGKKARKKFLNDTAATVLSLPERLILPKVNPSYSFTDSIKNFMMLTKMEFIGMVKSIYFIAIVFAGMVFLFINGIEIGKMYDTNIYPVTHEVISIAGGTFKLFMLIIIIFYSGELVWKERNLKVSQFIDSFPVGNQLIYGSKLSALLLVQVVLLAVIMVSGIIIQTLKGYYNYEIPLYLKSLFGINLVDMALFTVLSMFVQVLVNHKYVGYFILVIYYLFTIFMVPLGLEHNLYNYSSDPGLPYSDMNGYGHFVFPFGVFKLYWTALAMLLVLIGRYFWIRGTEPGFKWRMHNARLQLTKSGFSLGMFFMLLFLSSGGYIYYNTNVVNKYQTNFESEVEVVEYENKYKKFEGIPQPRITAVNVHLDIFPEELNMFFKGTNVLKNKTAVEIDSIHINIPSEAEIRKMKFSSNYKPVLEDKKLGYYIYKLEKPLLPGDSITLEYELAYVRKGFKNSGNSSPVVSNGSFIHSSFLPSIGYSEEGELGEDDSRKKHKLAPKPRMADVNNLEARMNTYIARDADWVTFEATVSTTPGQIAIAPGYLIKEWNENGRRYFHYKMDAPILNFYAFLSARYELKKDKWVSPDGKDVNIEVYYHKGHEYNLDRMIKSVKKSLDYYTANFSPYQHRQVRILEFPGYSSFAQAFPNTIPFSESIGFIAKVDDENPEDIDYPFYITAHEVAHQWWAHQVIGGNVQGAVVMSETMSQYASLMVMEKEYGKDKMKKFLEYELDRYLAGRSHERKKELPLILAENQGYIHYQKGSLVMYALRDYIGEENLNAALKKYIQKVAFQEPPYTNSMEFLSYIKEATPDSLQYLITDMFETITFYDNRITSATAEKMKDGKYKVKLTIEAKKLRADSVGNETAVPKLNDWIEIGIMAKKKDNDKKDEKHLYLKKHKITNKTTTLELIVNEKPARAEIDPICKLIDKERDDNVKEVSVN